MPVQAQRECTSLPETANLWALFGYQLPRRSCYLPVDFLHLGNQRTSSEAGDRALSRQSGLAAKQTEKPSPAMSYHCGVDELERLRERMQHPLTRLVSSDVDQSQAGTKSPEQHETPKTGRPEVLSGTADLPVSWDAKKTEVTRTMAEPRHVSPDREATKTFVWTGHAE